MYEVTLQFCTKILKLYLLLYNINLYLYIKQMEHSAAKKTNIITYIIIVIFTIIALISNDKKTVTHY